MFVDADYRRWVVRQVRDPFVKQFWEQEFENYDLRFMREAIAPIQNKVGALLQSPMLRNILGQIRNRVSIPFTMDNRRISATSETSSPSESAIPMPLCSPASSGTKFVPMPSLTSHASTHSLVWSAEQRASSERGIFSKS
jgi:hypothetical protein